MLVKFDAEEVTSKSTVLQIKLRPAFFCKAGIADPEGLTINEAISQLGYQGVSGVSSGKVFRLSSSSIHLDCPDIAELPFGSPPVPQ